MGLSVIMLAYPAATFDKLTSGAAGNARAIVFKGGNNNEGNVFQGQAFLRPFSRFTPVDFLWRRRRR
jgi:hypothetical protein